jgi:REP-associated tyrosine transposase
MQITQSHPARRTLRLPNHDYSHAGPYFVTICTQNKVCSLGTVQGEQVDLNPAGRVARESWYSLPERFPQLVLDEFIIMPNHLHAILAFVGEGLAPPSSALAQPETMLNESNQANRCSLPSVIGAFKSISTIRINRLLKRAGQPFWQRSYYDHIIRNGDDMKNAQRYILENPLMWSLDPEHPELRNR